MNKQLVWVVIFGALAYYYQDTLLGWWQFASDWFVVGLVVFLCLSIGLGLLARLRDARDDRRIQERILQDKASRAKQVAPQVVYALPQGYGMTQPAQPPQAKATFIELPAERIELL